MDLDFSFALVSSLTPRSQPSKTILTENNKLSSKSRKNKTTKRVSSKSQSTNSSRNHKDHNKENHLFEEKLMNKHDCLQQDTYPHYDLCSNKQSPCYEVNMANIAVRSNKHSRDRRKKRLDSTESRIIMNNIKSIDDRISIGSIEGRLQITHNSEEKEVTNQRKSNKILVEDNISFVSCNSTNTSITNLVKKGRKRKSTLQNVGGKISEMSDSVIDITDSSCSGVKLLSSEINEYKDLSSSKSLLKSPSKDSDLIESSLSTAYDSGSFKTIRRRGVKVISESPESEESSKNNLYSKKKCSLDSIFSNSNKSKDSDGTKERNGFLSCNSSSFGADSPRNMQTTWRSNDSNRYEKAKEKLDFNNIYSNTHYEKIGSLELNSRKDKKQLRKNSGASGYVAKENKKKSVTSPDLQETNSKVIEKVVDATIGKQSRNNKNVKSHIESAIKKGKKSKEITNGKHSRKTERKSDTEKFNFVPPSEEIPKFEHINNWLKDTQENSIIELSSSSSCNSPEKVSKPTKTKTKGLKSLSPRIKKKIQEAQSTLQEEQHIFEELFGSNLAKRLSDETEENLSNVGSNRESLEISEKVLEKIYGTVWQKDEVLPRSEPRKGRPKNSTKKNAPLTERKKHRTSIYDVFSSSSSEDRFEEFLENVHRGKLKSTHTLNDQPATSNFIDDSDSDCESSFAYYQTAISNAVKEDIENLRSPKLNRRRLSFASSQEECSESGRTDSKLKGKDTDVKITKPSTRSKKGTKRDVESKTTKRDVESKTYDDVNGFTLVTPIKVKDKKTDMNNEVRIKHLIENDLPKSIGKSKTPKNSDYKDNNTNSEERLKKKYLNEGDFKVPKSLKSLKTPNKPLKAGIPSSPALSFLSSLSELTAGLPCHPDALVYKKNFKDKREELTKKLFSLYNKEVFSNQLPANMLIEWSTRMTSTSGFCYNKRMYSNNQMFRSSRIVLSTKILDRSDRLRDTLIHEMCHAATWIINGTSDGHGPKWKAWADKANRRFPELPVIKRCHDYAISTKFTYKCMSCGYCIGRHSKSLNTDRKRCGFCYGKFEVFVTAKMSKGSVASGSDSVKSQRTPSGFALFVKENYAAVKKQNNVPHGQVMKLLSQKFADVKISKQKEKET